MKPTMIHSWFKPRYTFEIGGVAWCSEGHFALAMDPPEDDLKRPDPKQVQCGIDMARSQPGMSAVRVNGYATIGDDVFDGYIIDLCEAAYPIGEWRRSEEMAVRFDGGMPVAAAMRMSPGTSPSDPLRAPRCPACDGLGGIECDKCGGEGTVECECECGHQHDADCKTCKGKGYTSRCVECCGTKVWAPPTEPRP